MLKPLLLTLALALPTAHAHINRDLTGTYLGVSRYRPLHKGPNRAATRIYLNEVAGERGSYHAVLHEYVNLLGMAPQYIAANKAPKLSKVIGYLKNISKKISTYKVIPTKDEHIFNMYPLKVVGDKIVANKEETPRVLRLSEKADLKNALAGATISGVKKSHPNRIFFPDKRDGEVNGVQYSIANLVYEKVGLDSTWRKEFLPGPYLSAYGRLDDTVLNLKKEGAYETMEFVLNPKFEKKSNRRRRRMFTNGDSAFLKGMYESIEPVDGMFLLKSIDSEEKSDNILEGKIGLFIDIFDATKVLNQDVVELVFINPENPEDFLMYYEHPENGEGK